MGMEYFLVQRKLAACHTKVTVSPRNTSCLVNMPLKQSESTMTKLERMWFNKWSLPKDQLAKSYRESRQLKRNLFEVSVPSIPASFSRGRGFKQDYKQGWARKMKKVVNRFCKKQKDYIRRKFQKGEKSGRHYRPAEIEAEMKTLRNEAGTLVFKPRERLTEKQIQGQFTTMTKNLRKKQLQAQVEDNSDSDEEEVTFGSMVCDVLEEIPTNQQE